MKGLKWTCLRTHLKETRRDQPTMLIRHCYYWSRSIVFYWCLKTSVAPSLMWVNIMCLLCRTSWFYTRFKCPVSHFCYKYYFTKRPHIDYNMLYIAHIDMGFLKCFSPNSILPIWNVFIWLTWIDLIELICQLIWIVLMVLNRVGDIFECLDIWYEHIEW